MARPKHVVIIGGGFSGALTAIHLARSCTPNSPRITLVNTRHEVRILAYRFDDDNLLLNVPAGNMSALADEPEHFVAYCQRIDPSLSPDTLSRVGSMVSICRACGHKPWPNPGLIELRVDEAVALSRAIAEVWNAWQVTLASGGRLITDQVVLALGHQRPRCPIPLDSDIGARVM